MTAPLTPEQVADVDEALVEKGRAALREVQESWGEYVPSSETRMRARAVLAAVLPDVRRQMAEEIAAAIEGYPMGVTRRDCAGIARAAAKQQRGRSPA